MNDRLASICVHADATIRDAMLAIDHAGSEIALIVDDRDRLVGTLTDGDVRRALLRGAELGAPVGPHAHAPFIAVSPEVDRAAALELMQARGITELPVLDESGRVIALHLLRELLGVQERDNAAVVMAGGRGSRLGSLTRDLPKPLLHVAGRPILERLVLHLVGAGIRRVYLAVNYRAEQVETHFGDGSDFGCRIEYLREDPDRPLGTAGALALLPEPVRREQSPLLVMNGDLVTQFSVEGLCAAHERTGAAVTMGTSEHRYPVPFGVIERDGEDVRALVEKPTETWIVNAGVYAVRPSLIDWVVPDREYPMTELVSQCIIRGERVTAYGIAGDWLDVGTPRHLGEARGELT